jgi:D-sedoheptulose 7-phosphate isomerase
MHNEAATSSFYSQYINKLSNALNSLPQETFEEAVKTILEAFKKGRQIFAMGNGGSGATASHFVCDINKFSCSGLKTRFKAICLNDNIPTMLAYANDVSFEDIFSEQLKNLLCPEDVVIGISTSGNSKNVLKAIEYANVMNCRTIALTGSHGGSLAKLAQTSIKVPDDNTQRIEDVHLIIAHIFAQLVRERLRS